MSLFHDILGSKQNGFLISPQVVGDVAHVLPGVIRPQPGDRQNVLGPSIVCRDPKEQGIKCIHIWLSLSWLPTNLSFSLRTSVPLYHDTLGAGCPVMTHVNSAARPFPVRIVAFAKDTTVGLNFTLTSICADLVSPETVSVYQFTNFDQAPHCYR